jgi:PIN domain nuclease of toxin-antitoxin system
MTAGLLLDSNVVLFALLRPARLSVTAREAIENPANKRWISAATWYEVGYKIQIGKLKLPPDRDLNLALKLLQASALAITPDHMSRAAGLPIDNRDPFDRILAAQAIEEGLLLVSADENLNPLGAPLLW